MWTAVGSANFFGKIKTGKEGGGESFTVCQMFFSSLS